MYSLHDPEALPPVGFPIRKSPGLSLFSGSPKLIAAYHVLHRLPLPRHPPYALSSLTIKNSKINQSTRTYFTRFTQVPFPVNYLHDHATQPPPASYALLQISLYAIVKEHYYNYEF